MKNKFATFYASWLRMVRHREASHSIAWQGKAWFYGRYFEV